jgi:hypothetical protein
MVLPKSRRRNELRLRGLRVRRTRRYNYREKDTP